METYQFIQKQTIMGQWLDCHESCLYHQAFWMIEFPLPTSDVTFYHQTHDSHQTYFRSHRSLSKNVHSYSKVKPLQYPKCLGHCYCWRYSLETSLYTQNYPVWLQYYPRHNARLLWLRFQFVEIDLHTSWIELTKSYDESQQFTYPATAQPTTPSMPTQNIICAPKRPQHLFQSPSWSLLSSLSAHLNLSSFFAWSI